MFLDRCNLDCPVPLTSSDSISIGRNSVEIHVTEGCFKFDKHNCTPMGQMLCVIPTVSACHRLCS
jgi:hypothetical protein